MKRIITISILFLFVLFLSILELKVLASTVSSFTSDIKKIETLVNSENLDNAIIKSSELSQKWVKTRKTLSLFTDHEPLQELDESFALIEANLSQNQIEDFFGVSAVARFKLNFLIDSSLPTIKNIL